MPGAVQAQTSPSSRPGASGKDVDTGSASRPYVGPAENQEAWHDLFRRKKLPPQEVADTVQKLHKAKRHDQVIACIEAALAAGQSQPWMYDVLAVSMKIAGRPADEIERVLLSRADLATTDVPSLLYSAAFLTRLEGHSAALQLYRQASRIDPTSPEPYVLGLKLARDLKDYEGVEWASAGILMHAWTRDHVSRHREAENAAAEAEQELEKLGRHDAALRLRQAIAEAKRRDLIIRLEWVGDGDLDLTIEEPFGTVCSVGQPLSTGGGVLVHDGYGTKGKDCYDEYVCAQAGSGEYRVRISYLSGNIVGKQCQLIVTRHAGSPDQSVEKIAVKLDSTQKNVRLTLKHGRRQKPGSMPSAEPQSALGRAVPRHVMLARLFGRRTVDHTFAQLAGGNSGISAVRQTSAVTATGVGYQPVISVVSEGVSLTAAAIVSADRRYVRLAISPAFSSVVDIATFSFITQ